MSKPARTGRPGYLPGIPGYRIVRQLGQGGMATVYLAVQESLDRQVAIKVMASIASADEQQAQRFEHEARVVGKLEHPAIVNIHEVGRTHEGQLYYVMPYLAGGDLSHREISNDEPRILDILRTLLDALAYAHARGIVHRDVKAENVLFDGADRPLLADFGIALSKRSATRLTVTGMTLGSGGYMAPEQSRGEEVDHRADLYSVGVLAYELLTGELPYQAEEPVALALMHGHDPIPRLPRSKRHWQAFIDRAMAKSPDRRFRNARAMLRALEPVERRVRGGGVTLGELGYALLHDPAWRKPWALTAMGVLLAAALAWQVPPLILPAGGETPAEPAAAPDIESQVLARALKQAENQFTAQAVLQPSGANAAETWLGVLRMDADNIEAQAGLVRVLDWIAQRGASALEAGDIDAFESHHRAAELLRDSAAGALDAAFVAFADAQRRALESDVRGAIAASDHARASRGSALLVDLGLGDPIDVPAPAPARVRTADTTAAASAPNSAADATQVGAAAAAIEAFAVSRSEYREFAEATGREPARCHLLLSPLRLFNPRDWRHFGSDGDPVVCVSYDDALAYAEWRSQREGANFRLPESADATAPAIGVSHWTSACATAVNAVTGDRRSDCQRRVVAGADASARPAPIDRGYDEVGLLLVREG